MSARRALLPLIAVFVTAFSASARSAGPEGLWLVDDKTGRIKIEKCGNEMWGFIAWQKDPRNDTNNPNPAMHGKPLVGSPILIGMKAVAADRWEGNVYNPRDGRVYSSKMAMLPSGHLEIKGCVMGGLICGGENWTRLPEPAAAGGAAARSYCAAARSPVSR